MFRLEWLFLMQLAMGVLMIVFLQKLNQMKEQVDEITKEVTNYISYITEDLEEEAKKEETSTIGTKKKQNEDAQNRLIQEVLGEYFL